MMSHRFQGDASAARSALKLIAGRTPRSRRRRVLAVAVALALVAVPWLSQGAAFAASSSSSPSPKPRADASAEEGREEPAAKGKTKGKATARAESGPASTQGAKGAKGATSAGQGTSDERPGEKRNKKTAARSGTAEHRAAKKGAKAAPPKPCLGPVVSIDRGGLESERIALVDCAGKPRKEAQRRLSVLARPWGAARPDHLEKHAPGKAPREGKHAGDERGAELRARRHAGAGEIAPGVRLVDSGLLLRINALARKHPGSTITLVSGYRPQSQGSLHQSARALDLRIAGVRNQDLVAACRALPDTGCGYYPNSSFVHVDVRAPGTGMVSWIDASGPGEAPRYVTTWPPPADESSTPDKAGDPEVAADVVAHAPEDQVAEGTKRRDSGEGTPEREVEADREPVEGEPQPAKHDVKASAEEPPNAGGAEEHIKAGGAEERTTGGSRARGATATTRHAKQARADSRHGAHRRAAAVAPEGRGSEPDGAQASERPR